MISKAGIRFLGAALSCPRLLCFGSTIVAPLFVLLGSGGLPSACRFGFGPRRLPDAFSCLVDHCFTSNYSYLWCVHFDRILQLHAIQPKCYLIYCISDFNFVSF